MRSLYFVGALTVLAIGTPFLLYSRQTVTTDQMTITGCLSRGTAAGTFVLIEETTGKQFTVTGPAGLSAHADGHKMTLTGKMLQENGRQIFRANNFQHVASTCQAKSTTEIHVHPQTQVIGTARPTNGARVDRPEAVRGKQMTLTGCLINQADTRNFFVLTDENSGKQYIVSGDSTLARHATGHRVRLTGVFKVDKLEHLSESCTAPQGVAIDGVEAVAGDIVVAGCLGRTDQQGVFVVTDDMTGQNTRVTGNPDLSKHLGHKVRITGNRRPGDAMVNVTRLEHIAETCEVRR